MQRNEKKPIGGEIKSGSEGNERKTGKMPRNEEKTIEGGKKIEAKGRKQLKYAEKREETD